MTGRRTPSEIHIVGGICEVSLNGMNANGRKAIIDEADIPLVQGYSWYVKGHDPKQSYVLSHVGGMKGRKLLYLHRLIRNAQPGEVVDHQNHNPLDCRRSNLRVCSVAQNAMNSRKQTSPTSSQTYLKFPD
jgi:hypothetical protein